MKRMLLTAVSAAIMLGVCLFNCSACGKDGNADPAYDVYLKAECYYMRDDELEPMYDTYHLEKTIILEKDEVTTDSLVLRTKGYYYFWISFYYHNIDRKAQDVRYTRIDVGLDDRRIPADVQNDKESPHVIMLEVPIHSYRGTIPARYALRLNIVPFEEIEEGEYRDKLLEEMT